MVELLRKKTSFTCTLCYTFIMSSYVVSVLSKTSVDLSSLFMKTPNKCMLSENSRLCHAVSRLRSTAVNWRTLFRYLYKSICMEFLFDKEFDRCICWMSFCYRFCGTVVVSCIYRSRHTAMFALEWEILVSTAICFFSTG